MRYTPYDREPLPRHETNQTNAVRTENPPEPLRHDLTISKEELMQELKKLRCIIRGPRKLRLDPKKRDTSK